MLAQRTGKILGKLVALIDISADFAYPACFFTLLLLWLRLDIFVIISVRSGRLIRQHLGFFNLGNENIVSAYVNGVNNLCGEERICALGYIVYAVGRSFIP